MRILVLDTNILLHDVNCIDQLSSDNLVIPISVIEELDTFKKGHDAINYNARAFLRKLEELRCKELFTTGVSLGENKGVLKVSLEVILDPEVKMIFGNDIPDHRIINVAYMIASRNKDKKVIMVSKDVNLRLKAGALGIDAEDFDIDKTANATGLYTGSRIIEDVSKNILDKISMGMQEVDVKELELDEDLIDNEYLVLRNEKKSILAKFNASINKVQKLEDKSVQGVKPKNADQAFALNAILDPKISLVTLSGKAGTGKTLIALAGALQAGKKYDRILISRPIVALSDNDLGFLPGDVNDKISPYLEPLYDNLSVIQGLCSTVDQKTFNMQYFMQSKKIEVIPLAYIRGRSLINSFFIVDEAQNLSAHEMKTIITRAGEGTKIVLTGDIFQIDHQNLDSQSNGLSYLIEKFTGQSVYAHINLEKGERSLLAELASNLL